MKVSAVIITYNRRAYIERAIDSILAQTVPVNEIVVVDDGSTDGTSDLVASRYGNRVRLIRQKNAGVSGARRRGVLEANGEWVAFLDSDDEWLPERNALLLDAVSRVPQDVAWVFGDLHVVTDQGEGASLFEEYGLSVNGSPQIFADSLSVQYPFQFGMLQGSFIRRNALLELECFTIKLLSDDDLLAGFQIACRYRVAAIAAPVGKYYRTSDLASSSVVVNGNLKPDYHRSRMLAFAGVIQTGRRHPWNLRYASEVRGLYQMLYRLGSETPRSLAMEQFRYGGLSVKGLAFLCAAMAGPAGMRLWDTMGSLWRKQQATGESATGSKTGHRAYFESIASKN